MKASVVVRVFVAASIIWLSTGSGFVQAQGFGGFGGAGSQPRSELGGDSAGVWHSGGRLTKLDPVTALSVITIDGTADLRVVPEEIRVVMATTSEAETADQCQQKNAAQVKAVLDAWAGLKIPPEDIVEDFINVLPVYQWGLAERAGEQVRIQQLTAYRMQSNLHVRVKTEKDAMAAINLAFKNGVTEIVTFDYWSSKLDEQKEKARAAAIAAAKNKAATLLAVFDAPPKVINVQESTAVFFPHALYRTYENVLQEEVEYSGAWRDKPAIKAFRPKMTFFNGLQSESDQRPDQAAIRPEIAVVSTVRLYYESPAQKSLPPRKE